MTHPKSDFLKFIGTPFEPYILPIIPAGAKLHPDSTLGAGDLGKIPGTWSSRHHVWYGFPKWTSYWSSKFDLERWDEWQAPDKCDTAIAIGMRLVTCTAIDIDDNDEERAQAIVALAVMVLGRPLCIRRREGSSRRTMIYLFKQNTFPIGKSRVAYTTGEGSEVSAVEVLGQGQQTVIEGPHAKGAMQYWEEGAGLVELVKRIDAMEKEAGKEEGQRYARVTIGSIGRFNQHVAAKVEGWGFQLHRSGGRGKTYETALELHNIASPVSPLRVKDDELPTLVKAMQAINLDHPSIDYDAFIKLNRALCAATGCDMKFFSEVVWPWVCKQTVARGNGPRTEDRGIEWLEDKWRTFHRSGIGANYVYAVAAAEPFNCQEARDALYKSDIDAEALFGGSSGSTAEDRGSGAERGADDGDDGSNVANVPRGADSGRVASKVFRAELSPDVGEPPARRAVQIDGEYLATAVDAVEQAMIEQGVGLFSRSDRIVRPGAAQIQITNSREITGERLYAVEAAELREHMTQCARFVKWNATSRQWTPTNAPDDVAKAYLARVGRWKLRPLSGIITAPTLRADGSLIDKPGYDEATALLYRPDPNLVLPPLMEAPTQDHARAALMILQKLISTFPFVSSIDRSVALSAILTTVVRRTLPRAPMHAFTAPTPGSGKGKLVDVAAVIATGREASVAVQGRNEEETEKRLVALLLTGDPVLLLDNCTLPVEGDFLCSLLTSEYVQPRILGASRAPRLLANTAIFATGNNLVVDSDMVRRSLVSEIDPMCEHPELRHFDFDPVEEAKRNRGAYLCAALTILQAFALAGRPPQSEPLGSFEAWNHIRDALLWLDQADPCACQKELKKSSPEQEDLAALLSAWCETLGDGSYTLKQAIQAAANKEGGGRLVEAMQSVMPGKASDDPLGINLRSLGKYFAPSREENFSGLPPRPRRRKPPRSAVARRKTLKRGVWLLQRGV